MPSMWDNIVSAMGNWNQCVHPGSLREARPIILIETLPTLDRTEHGKALFVF